MRPIDTFFLSQSEPNRSCLLALRNIIHDFNDDIEEAWKYKLPFFYFRKKPLCYLWMDKKTTHPYIGFVKGKHLDFPELEQGNRKKMKILSINPHKDIPLEIIATLLEASLKLYD